jgi:hypothetical protein
MTPLIREWVKYYALAGGDPTDGMWFDITNALHIEDTKALAYTMTNYRPPFKRNFCVAKGMQHGKTHEVMLTVAGDDPEEGIVVSCWIGVDRQKPRRFPMVTYTVRDGRIYANAEDEMADIDKQMIARLIALWYVGLDQGTTAHTASVKRGITSTRLLSKGKPPIYEWRTVAIEPSKPKQDSQGGTHASPRLHDRRGHLRKLPSGKTCWVKACKVGDANKGTVFHDYKVAT